MAYAILIPWKSTGDGQRVDGFVEAPNAQAGIDRLADRGIIGLYSLRVAPAALKRPRTLPPFPESDQRRIPTDQALEITRSGKGRWVRVIWFFSDHALIGGIIAGIVGTVVGGWILKRFLP